MKILANEFIVPLREGWQSHASHILPLPGGEVYAVFFYGSREGNPDIRIYGARRSAEGRWRLTPKGYLISNDIITDLLLIQDKTEQMQRFRF